MSGSVRVFLPVTRADLVAMHRDGLLPLPDGGVRVAHAVTPALRASWPDGDEEEWAYAALLTAAHDSIEALARHDGDDEQEPRRRVVAADVPAVVASPDPDAAETGVGVALAVELAWVEAWHVDEPEAAPAVRAAVAALRSSDAAEDDVVAALEACLEHDLGWYARQELDQLV